MADQRAAAETSSSATEEFEAFYGGWIVEQQRLLDQLIRLSNQDDARRQEEAVKEAMSHYALYYEEKAKAMASGELCFPSIHPVSSLEEVVLWMGGFRPSYAVTLLEGSVADLSPEQRRRVEAVRAEVEEGERAVEGANEGVLAAGRGAGVEDGCIGVAEEEVERAMREVMGWADRLRWEAVRKAVAGLSGRQKVKLLVAVGSYHLGLRSLGLNHPLM